MPENQLLDGSLLPAALIGLASGFVFSIPVGPIGATIIHEGGRHGFRWGLLIGLGAVAMEAIYCAIGFAGFSTLFGTMPWRAVMELLSFLVVVWLGFHYLLAHRLPASPHTAEELERRLHPHTAFFTGFVRVLGNPGVLMLWATVSATFISHEWVEPVWRSKAACVAGVAVGAAGWFGLLSYLVSLGHRHLSDNALLRMTQASGALMLGAAALLGWRLVNLLMQVRH